MGVKPFNVAAFTTINRIEAKEVGYRDSIDIIYDELHKTRKSFIKIGWYLKHINEEKMYAEDGYSNIYEFAHDKFNISQPTATRFINLCNEFSVGHDSPELDEKYLDFSISQLFEMLPMKPEEKEQITSDMTVKEIREVKKEKQSLNEPKDADITRVVNKVNELIPVEDTELEAVEDSDNNIPGQTSIEKDFPEYMPDSAIMEKSCPEEKYATSHKNEEDEQEVIDGECREVDVSVETMQELFVPGETEENLLDEIDELRTAIERTFFFRECEISLKEVEEAKENAKRLVIAIEKFYLNMLK